MALDWPFFGNALWLVSDEIGVRPEWQLTVISLETAGTFEPSVLNPIGCVGLNQFCSPTYSRYVHVPKDTYRRWSASRQLSGPILDFWRDAQSYGGPIRSSVKLMIAQLGQPWRHARLDTVIFSEPSKEYRANRAFDPSLSGFITVRDIAKALANHADAATTQDAIKKAYALRPDETPTDPVYGADFPEPTRQGSKLVTVGLMSLAAASYGLYRWRRHGAHNR